MSKTAPNAAITLTLAHSADADDVFMWWPITGKVDPANPERVLSPAVLDTHGIRFISVPEDISKLNQRAVAVGDLDITAVSFATLPRIWDKYAPTVCGSSFGDDWGPKLVRQGQRPEITLESIRSAAADGRRYRLAIPGRGTTAWACLCSVLGSAELFDIVETPFDQIVGTVAAGKADLGLLIHESQLTFQNAGLAALMDLGVEFKRRHGLPLPLGSNAVRRDLDARFGAGTLQRVVNLLDESIRYALAHRAESLEYARAFSPLKDDATLDRYITLYVNKYTVDARPDGVKAARVMLGAAADLGVVPRIELFEMLDPTR